MPTVFYGTVRRYEKASDRSGTSRGVPRPMLPVRLVGRWVGPEFLALVDSGADRSLFHSDQAELAGIDLSRCPLRSVRGIGNAIAVRIRQTAIEVEGRRCEIDAYFTDDPNQRTTALLGREGVFTEFQFGFDQRAGKLMVEPYDP